MRRGLAVLLGAPLLGADFSQRGFVELRTVLYPQTAANDRARVVAEGLLRYEALFKFSGWLRAAGALDARTDTHHQTSRGFQVSVWDRERQRPAFALRRFSVAVNRGSFTAEFGRQFVRWGKADVLNPTDRFAPRDFLTVVDNDFLAVTAARWSWERQGHTLDAVLAPRFTPSRIPLLNQRWVVVPEALRGIPLADGGARFPGGAQFGLRWNHVARGFEHSFSFYEGFHHLPLFEGRPAFGRIEVVRFYPALRMYGADAAAPLRWITLKGEAAWFTSRTAQADEYVQYVVQAERQSGEWFLVGGYAGERVTRRRNPFGFAPDRGLTRAFLGRAGYTIDANRSLAFEGAVRRNGKGLWLRIEYSQGLGAHWRLTSSFTLIRGAQEDFLGQYRRNSHGILSLRYSF
ncbi:MAG: hypothetical protein NZM33_14130 [Bryobacteraceae bacterium]|nr:hypothetical protein [Bryobacteraceae bacterium]